MSQIESKHFVNSLNYLFKETFEGSPPQGSIYLDRGIGVFSTLENLDAKAASTFSGTTTIAAHVEHLRYYLEVLSNFMKGIVQAADWNRSWEKKKLTDEEWETLKNSLRETYDSVLKAYEKTENWNEDMISEAVAIIAHTAYHLGAIRQMAKSSEPIVLTKVH